MKIFNLRRWRQGATPLHAAAARGKVETVQLLVEARAVVSRNAQGLTPLELAHRLLGSVPEVCVDAINGAPNIANIAVVPDNLTSPQRKA